MILLSQITAVARPAVAIVGLSLSMAPLAVATHAHEPTPVSVSPSADVHAVPTTKPGPRTVWKIEEIATAKAQCEQLLKGLDIVALPADPMRDGDCGAPSPIELVSIGRKPEVAFSPPVTVTCELAAGLHRWIKQDLQPLARRQLGAPIVRIETMSSYSCRNAYGRTRTKLSEHGRANAIDVRGFLTSNGASAEVLADWGMTAREIRAQVAAARAAAERNQASVVAAAKAQALLKPTLPAPAAAPAPAPTGVAHAPATPAAGVVAASQPAGITLPRPSISVGTRGNAVDLPGVGNPTGLSLDTIFGPPSRLGGTREGAAGPVTDDAKTQFLRAVHAGACRYFGTVLGPEANTAHRNHFHFDMAPRAQANFCE